MATARVLRYSTGNRANEGFLPVRIGGELVWARVGGIEEYGEIVAGGAGSFIFPLEICEEEQRLLMLFKGALCLRKETTLWLFRDSAGTYYVLPRYIEEAEYIPHGSTLTVIRMIEREMAN